jgi:hypothetical protein
MRISSANRPGGDGGPSLFCILCLFAAPAWLPQFCSPWAVQKELFRSGPVKSDNSGRNAQRQEGIPDSRLPGIPPSDHRIMRVALLILMTRDQVLM